MGCFRSKPARLPLEMAIEMMFCWRGERGNGMLKRGRLLRAIDHYERGSSFMDAAWRALCWHFRAIFYDRPAYIYTRFQA